MPGVIRDVIERPIELAPDKHRALLLEDRGELVLPMRPAPDVAPALRLALVDALEAVGVDGHGMQPAELLDAAFRDGLLPEWRCPWGRGGDRLWGREPWAKIGLHFHYASRSYEALRLVWLPSSTMPRAAARLVLKIDDVGIGADEAGALVWRIAVEVCR
jgi:hypothetical protein